MGLSNNYLYFIILYRSYFDDSDCVIPEDILELLNKLAKSVKFHRIEIRLAFIIRRCSPEIF
jgi:hypothetical protein